MTRRPPGPSWTRPPSPWPASPAPPPTAPAPGAPAPASTGTGPSPGPAPPAPSYPPHPQSPHLVLSRLPASRRPVESDRRQPARVRGELALNRHARADGGISPRTRRKATTGDRSDPIVTTAASSQADTVSAGHRPAAAAAAAATATTASPRRAARRVQRHRVRRQDARQPGEELPHPARRGPEPAQPVPHRVLRDPATPPRSTGTPAPRAARASMSPITAVPSHRRASSHAGSSTCVDPARGAPRPPRPHRHREPGPP